MLIGVCGAICSGKSTIANYLVEHHGFQRLYLIEWASEKDDGTKPTKEDRSLVANTSASGTTPSPRIFTSPDELLAFVTKNWRSRYVTTHIHSSVLLDQLSRRPFFLLISVDAPIMKRYQRYLSRADKDAQLEETMDLATFAEESDEHLYSPQTGLLSLSARANITLLNTSSSVAHLYATLGRLSLQDEGRLRPSWDAYFMSLASLASLRSNCMKRRVGCVLVRDRRVVATGYNGTPRGLTNCSHGGCPRCNSGEGSGMSLATCLCLHAEENALLEAGRGRISGGDGGGEGAILYCDTCPCLTCSIKIAQVGIHEVVYAQGYSMDEHTATVLGEAGVRLRQFVPPANGLIHLENLELN